MSTISSNIESYNSDHSYYALSNASNGYHDSTNTSYASVNLTRGSGASTYIYWEFDLPTIPDGSTINSITCNYKARTSNSSTSYIASATIQLCSNKTTKGTSKSIRTTSTTASSFTSAGIGTWTVAEINAGVKLKTSATRGTSRTTSNYYIYFYGADIEITYTEAATGNKVYIKSYGEWKEADDILVKVNGSWASVADAYKKVSGSWAKQQDKSAMFDSNALYAKGLAYVNGAMVMNLDGITSYANRYSDEYLEIGISDVGMLHPDVVCDGKSFEFNGTSAYMIPSASATLDTFLYTTHTFEIYFEPYSWGNEDGNRTSIYIGRANNSVGLFAFITSGVPSLIRNSTTSNKMLQLSELPAANIKHYLAFNNTGWLYDGTYYSNADLNTPTNSIGVNNQLVVNDQYKCVSIGRRFKDNTNPQYYHGKIYAIRIHNAVLTEEDMRNNMECDIRRFNT